MSAVKPVNGITPETYQRLLYDSGAVYFDYGEAGQALIGATRGGNSIAIEDETREMPVDGAPGPVKDSQRITRTVAKLTVNLIEMSTAAIKASLAGSVSAADATHDVITRSRQINSNDYFDNVTLVLKKSGTDELYIVKIENALALGNYELGAAEDDESVLTMEFTGHFDANDLGTQPWSISNPLEPGATYYTLTYTAGANGSIIGDTSQTIVAGDDGSAVYASPASGYQFDQWSDASTDNPRTDTSVAADVTQTASFIVV